jgi:small subunit ribosomal protein S1
MGTVIRKVQGGCIVNLSGVSAFLPKTHFPAGVKEIKELFGKQHACFIIKMDRAKSNIVVSLKNSSDSEGIGNFAEGQIVQGTVKSLNEIMAFVDLGGVTGRLHISEISWNKIKEPASVLKIGEIINVKIIAISQTNKISLSIKELLENPWNEIVKQNNISLGNIYEGQVKFIDERFATIEILPNIEAKLKNIDVSWIKRHQNFDSLKRDQKVSVKVIEIDNKRNKIFVSIKNAGNNPLEEFAKNHQVGDEVQAKIVQISELGYVAQINDQLDGLIPKSSAYVSGNIKIGETVKTYIWNISIENSRIMLGINKPSSIS